MIGCTCSAGMPECSTIVSLIIRKFERGSLKGTARSSTSHRLVRTQGSWRQSGSYISRS
jgi:hypothetical protein